MRNRPLRVGDVIVADRKQTPTYIVVGRTTRGKLRLRRLGDTESTTWWTTTKSLPEGYRVAA